MPYQPSLEPLYECAQRFRTIFYASVRRQHEVSETGQTLRASNRPTCKKYYADDSTSEREMFFLVCHALWRANIRFWFHNIDKQGILDIGKYVSEMQRSQALPEVQTSIVRTFGALWLLAGQIKETNVIYYAARMLSRMNACVLTLTFGCSWTDFCVWISVTILIAAITMFLMKGADVNVQRVFIPYFRFVFRRYADSSPDDAVIPWKYLPMRIMAFSSGEIACLLGLLSPASDVSIQAALVLQLIVRAEQHELAPLPPYLSREMIKIRWKIYEQIGNERHQLVGRAAHQRRLRQILSVLATPNSISLVFFNLAYQHWSELMKLMLSAPDAADPVRLH